MRLGGRGVMGRYCRLLAALIVCSTVVSVILLSKLWGLGSGVSSGFHKLFASVTSKMYVDPFEEEFKGKDRMPPSVESMEEKKKFHTGDALLDYYLTMNDIDGIQITWYNGVNSKGLLMVAMKDYHAMMLEADVQVRWDDGTNKRNGTAVMSSKPDNLADITLFDWLSVVARYSNKGVKLNFASIHALTYGMPVLSNLKGTLHAPVWVHADILPGPNSNAAEILVNPEDFIKTTTSSGLPELSLSVGWATAWYPDPYQQGYTWHNVIAMARACALVKVPVSFSVRAVFASKSTRQLKWLLSLAKRFTATVWADKYDIMPAAELAYFRQVMDRKKVFYDLPSAFVGNLKKVAPNTISVGTVAGSTTWDRTAWDPVLLYDNSLVFLGKDQAVLDGPGCWLVSKLPYKSDMKKSIITAVSGKVQFVETSLASPSADSVLDVYIRSSGIHYPPANDQVQGVRLRIHRDGSLQLAPVNLNQAGVFKLQSTAELPASECYEFQLVDKGDGYPLHCTVKLWQCTPAEKIEADPLATSVTLHLMNVAYETKQLFYVAINGGSDTNAVVVEKLSVNDKAWT